MIAVKRQASINKFSIPFVSFCDLMQLKFKMVKFVRFCEKFDLFLVMIFGFQCQNNPAASILNKVSPIWKAPYPFFYVVCFEVPICSNRGFAPQFQMCSPTKIVYTIR